MDHPPIAPSRKRRNKLLIGGAVVAFTLVGLVAWAMGRPGSTSFYMTPTELAALGPQAAVEDYRVSGDVVPGTIERDGLITTFDVSDGSTQVTITTDAALPDAFYGKDTVEVVAQGNYDGSLFTASEVFAKCPSKFEAKQ